MRDLHELTGYAMALPMNSGAEAVETALKAARKWGEVVKGVAHDRTEIIVCANNFHGRTIAIVGFSTDAQYFWAGFGPFPRRDFGMSHLAISMPCEGRLGRRPVHSWSSRYRVKAGVIVPPDGYLREAARLCRPENNVLLHRG